MKPRNTSVSFLYRILKGSQGYTLPYVLMIIAVLGLFVPVIMSMNTNRSMTDIKRHNDKTATYLAESSIESFVRFLLNLRDSKKTIDNSTITSSLASYQGNLGTDPSSSNYWLQYSLPDGTPVKYHFDCSLNQSNNIIANVTVYAGTGIYKSIKVLNYSIQGPSVSSGNSGSTNSSSNELLNSALAYQNAINKWGFYGNIITSSNDANFTSDFTSLIPSSPTYTISATSLQSSYSSLNIPSQLANKTNTIVIHASTSTFTLDSSIVGNYPTVIYIDNPNQGTNFTVNISSDLLINTMVVVNGVVNFDNSSGITTQGLGNFDLGDFTNQKLNGNLGTVVLGNVVSNGTIKQTDGSKFTVIGTLAGYNPNNGVFGNNNQNSYINPQNDNYIPYNWNYNYSNGTSSWSPNPVKN